MAKKERKVFSGSKPLTTRLSVRVVCLCVCLKYFAFYALFRSSLFSPTFFWYWTLKAMFHLTCFLRFSLSVSKIRYFSSSLSLSSSFHINIYSCSKAKDTTNLFLRLIHSLFPSCYDFLYHILLFELLVVVSGLSVCVWDFPWVSIVLWGHSQLSAPGFRAAH